MTPEEELEAEVAADYRRSLAGGMTLSELWAETEGEQQYLLRPFLPDEGLVILGGRPKSGKTFIATWMTVECAKQGRRVTFVEEEGSARTLRKRFAPALGHEIPSALNENVRIAHSGGMKLDDDISVRAFIEGQSQFRPDLVVLDSLYVMLSADVKDQKAMSAVFTGLKRIRTELRCCILLIHHARKRSGEETKQLEDIDQLLGTVLLGANCDLMMFANKADKNEDELRIQLSCPPNGSRLDEPFPEYTWLMTKSGVKCGLDEEALRRSVQSPQERKQDAWNEKQAERLFMVRQAIEKLPPRQKVSIRDVYSALTMGAPVDRNFYSWAAQQLMLDGLLVSEGEGNGKRYFRT